ncbi:MAG: Gfo/Idh/MocA family protein [Sphingomonadaceae bacterium]
MTKRFGVGIIGLEPRRSWAATAHLPALAALRDDFELVGVANRTAESSASAAAACGLKRGFASAEDLIASADVHIVTITVKVPHHHRLVAAALDAGKHVYCEWPLGNGLQEAVELAQIARTRNLVAVAGMQALFAPEIIQLRALIADGFIGDVLSTSLTGTGGQWGDTVQRANHYVLDRSNGATLLSIPVGHVLAAMTDVLGPIDTLSATLANCRHGARDTETNELIPMTAHDQVLVNGLLSSGAPFSLHYRGGDGLSDGFVWTVHGSAGELRLEGPLGHAQLAPLSLSGGKAGENAMQPLALSATLAADSRDGAVAGNVRRLYAAMAHDLRSGDRTAPRFDDAVAVHRIIESIERSDETGRRVSLSKT